MSQFSILYHLTIIDHTCLVTLPRGLSPGYYALSYRQQLNATASYPNPRSPPPPHSTPWPKKANLSQMRSRLGLFNGVTSRSLPYLSRLTYYALSTSVSEAQKEQPEPLFSVFQFTLEVCTSNPRDPPESNSLILLHVNVNE